MFVSNYIRVFLRFSFNNPYINMVFGRFSTVLLKPVCPPGPPPSHKGPYDVAFSISCGCTNIEWPTKHYHINSLSHKSRFCHTFDSWQPECPGRFTYTISSTTSSWQDVFSALLFPQLLPLLVLWYNTSIFFFVVSPIFGDIMLSLIVVSCYR